MNVFGDLNDANNTSGKDTYNKLSGALKLYNSFQSGFVNTTAALDALKDMNVFGKVENGKITDSAKQKNYDTLSSAFKLYSSFQNGQLNPTTMLESMKDLGVFGKVENGKITDSAKQKSYDSMSGALELFGSFQNGNFNADTAFSALDKMGALKNMSDKEKENTKGYLGLLTAFNGDPNPKTVTNFLFDNTTLFKNMSDKDKGLYKSLLGGVFDMAMSGNINAVQVATLGFKAAGIESVKISGIGSVPIGTLLNGISNPQGLAMSLAQQYLTNVIKTQILGNIGLTGLAGTLVGAVMMMAINYLLSQMFPAKKVFSYTACGFYPSYDNEEKIQDKKYENELAIVNKAKEKALKENTAEAWGAYTEAKIKYDTIPTDEITADDNATKDEKYSDQALANEKTTLVQENNLTDVTTWAKNKTNNAVKCMDKVDGGGGVFTLEESQNGGQLTTEMKKQIAKYKIKVFLGNLLTMDSEAKQAEENSFLSNSTDTTYTRNFFFNYSGLDLTPTQIYTYGGDSNYSNNPQSVLGTPDISSTYLAANKTYNSGKGVFAWLTDSYASRVLAADATSSATTSNSSSGATDYDKNDVSHFYVIRDRLWGDDYGSPGSQDINLTDPLYKNGFFYNQKMYDRIHYGY